MVPHGKESRASAQAAIGHARRHGTGHAHGAQGGHAHAHADVHGAHGPARFHLGAWRTELARRTVAAVQGLRERIGSEHLYAFALFLEREDGFERVRASANTEEALGRRAQERGRIELRYRGEAGRRLLRWWVEQWEHHDFAPAIRELTLPAPAERRPGDDARIREAMLGALKAAERAGAFGRGAERSFLSVNLVWPHIRPAPFLRGLRRLNPICTVDRHLHETDPGPLVRCVNRAPRRERMRIWLALYEDLYMEWRTPIAEEARARGMSPWEVEEELVRFGAKVVPSLVDLLAHYGFASPFDHNRGLETREVWLAGSALFLARRIRSVPEKELRRLEQLVQAFAERDRRLRIAPTLAENTARVLHELRPRRYPAPIMDPATYKLQNPEAFVARAGR